MKSQGKHPSNHTQAKKQNIARPPSRLPSVPFQSPYFIPSPKVISILTFNPKDEFDCFWTLYK